MQTREKLGSQAKKILKICHEFNGSVINAEKIISICKDSVLQDIKKIVEILFILEGLGFITRVSKKNFIFTGIQGMASRIIEVVISSITKTSQDREHWLFSEDLNYENKKYSLRQSVYMGLFYQETLGLFFTSQIRTVSRDTIEKILEQLAYYMQAKDLNIALLFNEMTSIMTSLNLLDKRNQPETKQDLYELYQWIGPETMQTIQLDQFNPFSLTLKQELLDKIKISQDKESSYFQTLFRDIQDEFTKPQQLTKVPDNLCYPISHFPTAAYALLKSKNLTYFMKQLTVIIGRANPSKQSKYWWEVDVALDSTNRISKQHAIIQYNFTNEQYSMYQSSFEIRCISHKKPIVVDQTVISIKDKPAQLKHRSCIQISKAQIMFYLPKLPDQDNKEDDKNMDIE